MPDAKTRPPLRISAHGMWIARGGQYFFSLEGITQAECDKLETVLLAMNALDLSNPKARRALTAVVSTWPNWRVGRSDEQVEALSR